jgi:integrase
VAAPITFATKGEAMTWLATVEADQARGAWLDPRRGELTLEEYAGSWLQGHVRVAKRTREIYEGQLRLHILPAIDEAVPALGPTALADLTPVLIRRWYGALAEARGPSVAAKAYVRLRQILTQAVNDERITKNPCRIDRGGVEHPPEQRFTTMAELYALADAVPPLYRALILTAGLAGLRAGELFALRRSDVDLTSGVITVRRKRLRLASGETIEDAPKSSAGRRTVALPSILVRELEDHLAVHSSGSDPDAYVFSSPTGEPIERSNFRYRIWQPATKSVGLDGLRLHDLRHTAGTLAARTGATTKELMARLGHASPQASMIYQHAADDRDRLIAQRLDEMAAEAGVDSSTPGSDRDVPGPSGTDRARP